MATAAPLRLSQKDVAEMALKQGPRAQEVTYKYAQARLPMLLARVPYDWRLSVESGYEVDKTESQSVIGDYRFDRYRTVASLSKSLLTGTILSFNLNRTSEKVERPVTDTKPSQQTYDLVGIGIEQNLLANSFGYGDRAAVNKAEYDYQATMTIRANELQDVVLDVIRQFWNTYVAQENFREALASRDRYEKLVGAVRRKTSVGYSSPGELSQVQAEYETRLQTVKTASIDYLRNLDILLTSLSLSPGTEIEFDIPKTIPPVPKLSEKAIDELRIIRSQKLRIKAAEENVSVAKSKDAPTLNLVGNLNSSGVDETSEGSYSELSAGTHPKYYAGLKFQYTFGSGALREDVSAKKAALALEEVVLKRTLNEQRDKSLLSERNVSSTYAVALSAQKQKDLREKAVQELTRSYNQGRTDISILIEAMNKLFASEVQSIRALGDYQIALNEWAATRDELIPEEKESKP